MDFELSTVCRQLKMKAIDGKMRETDAANVPTLLRIIQSRLPSRAELNEKKFKPKLGKNWLAN